MSDTDPYIMLRREPEKAFRAAAHLQLRALDDGDVTRFLVAEDWQVYLTILYALLLFRRRHELAPLHADLYGYGRNQNRQDACGPTGKDAGTLPMPPLEVRRLRDRLIPLSPQARKGMAADLKANPAALSTDVLRSGLAEGGWLEQEAWEPKQAGDERRARGFGTGKGSGPG